MKNAHLLALPLLALALACGSAQAQNAPAATAAPPAAQSMPTRSKVAWHDRRFIAKAVESGMFEVQVGELAMQKASDSQVKNFGNMLVEQRKAANDALVQLANAKGVDVPAAPSRGQRRAIEKLAQRNGADFDRHFVREVGIQAHEKDIKAFEKASKDAKDADLKAWVDKTLPTLRDHLAAAEKLPQAQGDKNGGAMNAVKS